jgi:hypothetical protein
MSGMGNQEKVLFAVSLSLDENDKIYLPLNEIQSSILELIPLIDARQKLVGPLVDEAIDFFGDTWKVGNELIALQSHLLQAGVDTDYITSLVAILVGSRVSVATEGDKIASLLSVCFIRLTIQCAMLTHSTNQEKSNEK